MWAYQHGVELKLILPGKPIQYGYIESSTVSFGMNVGMSTGLVICAHAIELSKQWRIDYNENRTHAFFTSYQTPLKFTAAKRKLI